MIRTAPKPAPPVTPMTSGDASGFAERPLEQRAGHSERRADQDRLDRSRQPEDLDDLSVGPGRVAAEQDVDHIRKRDIHCPESERGDYRRRERDEQGDGDRGSPDAHARGGYFSVAQVSLRTTRIVRAMSVPACSRELSVEM